MIIHLFLFLFLSRQNTRKRKKIKQNIKKIFSLLSNEGKEERKREKKLGGKNKKDGIRPSTKKRLGAEATRHLGSAGGGGTATINGGEWGRRADKRGNWGRREEVGEEN